MIVYAAQQGPFSKKHTRPWAFRRHGWRAACDRAFREVNIAKIVEAAILYRIDTDSRDYTVWANTYGHLQRDVSELYFSLGRVGSQETVIVDQEGAIAVEKTRGQRRGWFLGTVCLPGKLDFNCAARIEFSCNAISQKVDWTQIRIKGRIGQLFWKVLEWCPVIPVSAAYRGCDPTFPLVSVGG